VLPSHTDLKNQGAVPSHLGSSALSCCSLARR
jgi:hypothetical protein